MKPGEGRSLSAGHSASAPVDAGPPRLLKALDLWAPPERRAEQRNMNQNAWRMPGAWHHGIVPVKASRHQNLGSLGSLLGTALVPSLGPSSGMTCSSHPPCAAALIVGVTFLDPHECVQSPGRVSI